MKPTEAKEWIDRLVEAGVGRTKATALINAYVEELGPLLARIAAASTLGVLVGSRVVEEEALAEPEKVAWSFCWELPVSKIEKAWRLLEKLSEEAMQKKLPTETEQMEHWFLSVNGKCDSILFPDSIPQFAPIFPSLEAVAEARDLLIRTGNAWWEGGGNV